ncbi:hypothetical protein BAXH7_03742 [Bacillus amyloliquefaciens XH7]|nr:hypothetical protein LL3_03754 [Bacillus amyloliquefaciens LL3]AEK90854.1 hypothetical protein BAXH7_03742 [Bacillus amyloliquefaciens XH7]KYC98992.1 hypothetical protein B425_3460 [Bacillus amyloliquefaciens]
MVEVFMTSPFTNFLNYKKRHRWASTLLEENLTHYLLSEKK